MHNNSIVIFGTGEAGLSVKSLCDKLSINVECFLDNNNEKWGKTVGGIPVRSPNDFITEFKKYKIVIASVYYDDISRQLNALDITNLLIAYNSNEECNKQFINAILAKNVFVNKTSRIINTILNSYITINQNSVLTNVEMGSYSYIGENAQLHNVIIGKFCSIAPSVKIGLGNHPTSFVSTSPVFFSQKKQCGISFADTEYFNENLRTYIGNDVWIGVNAYIKDGIKIGDGAIIGAGAVVVKDVPPYAIIGGVPAKIIKYRYTTDIINRLMKIKWWDFEEQKLKMLQRLIVSEDINAFLAECESVR